MKSYILRVLIAFDQLLNVVLFNGQPDETMSSAAYRMEQGGYFWGKLVRPLVDTLLWFDKDHCYQSYLSEKRRLQFPKEFQV